MTTPGRTMSDKKSSALWAIIQAHLDHYGVTEAEFARRMGSSPQTLSSWKIRGVHQLPGQERLKAVADLTGRPYMEVLDAALIDAGYISGPAARSAPVSDMTGGVPYQPPKESVFLDERERRLVDETIHCLVAKTAARGLEVSGR